MKSNKQHLKSIGVKILATIFSTTLGICFLVHSSLSLDTASKCLSVSIVVTFAILTLIDRFFWKNILCKVCQIKTIWLLFEKYECPVLCKEYDCLIKYEYPKGNYGEKHSKIKIAQTYTALTVSLITDEIKSDSTISEIVKENGNFVLYYIYNTVPKAQVLDRNKAQFGGCRIVLNSLGEDNNPLEGIYWTTSGTKGDMVLTPVENN